MVEKHMKMFDAYLATGENALAGRSLEVNKRHKINKITTLVAADNILFSVGRTPS